MVSVSARSCRRKAEPRVSHGVGGGQAAAAGSTGRPGRPLPPGLRPEVPPAGGVACNRRPRPLVRASALAGPVSNAYINAHMHPYINKYRHTMRERFGGVGQFIVFVGKNGLSSTLRVALYAIAQYIVLRTQSEYAGDTIWCVVYSTMVTIPGASKLRAWCAVSLHDVVRCFLHTAKCAAYSTLRSRMMLQLVQYHCVIPLTA